MAILQSSGCVGIVYEGKQMVHPLEMNMIRTNERSLIRMAVQGQVMPPRCYGWELTETGRGETLPSVGGITYNVLVGDSAYGWAADHVEPAVTFTASRAHLDSNPNKAFNAYACVGNKARLISGAAKGRVGTVTGHHGGVEHVIIDFPQEVLRKMTEDDKVLIEAHGSGLCLPDYPDLRCFGLSPVLFKKMGLVATREHTIKVPVVAVVPPEIMGSGIGALDNYKGDYDIQTQDRETLAELGLDHLRLGDLVALMDQDHRFGVGYRRGACSIGVVVHGDSLLTGHGPGVRVLMTDPGSALQPVIRKQANIGALLGIGRFRSKK